MEASKWAIFFTGLVIGWVLSCLVSAWWLNDLLTHKKEAEEEEKPSKGGYAWPFHKD